MVRNLPYDAKNELIGYALQKATKKLNADGGDNTYPYKITPQKASIDITEYRKISEEEGFEGFLYMFEEILSVHGIHNGIC